MLRECEYDCGAHGYCHNGTCQCAPGWWGPDCSHPWWCAACTVLVLPVPHPALTSAPCRLCLSRRSPNDCSKHGSCVDGQCKCGGDYLPPDCSTRRCPNDCHYNGYCRNGTCACKIGFSGIDCADGGCPNGCTGHGACVGGKCLCAQGWEAADCSVRVCPRRCSGHGVCLQDTGTCECEHGYGGDDCASSTLPPSPSPPIRLDHPLILPPEYVAHSTPVRPRKPAAPGSLPAAALVMPVSSVLPDGTLDPTRPIEEEVSAECHGHGIYSARKCYCKDGWRGAACQLRTCPNDCTGRGVCIDGQCRCEAGFEGVDCGELSCKNNCTGHGVCHHGACLCAEGYGGEDCSHHRCPNGCSGHGACAHGVCVCHPGWGGEGCALALCPNSCSGRGTCVAGVCSCVSGFGGADCALPASDTAAAAAAAAADGSVTGCPAGCGGRARGECIGGVCYCALGFTGLDCSHAVAPVEEHSATAAAATPAVRHSIGGMRKQPPPVLLQMEPAPTAVMPALVQTGEMELPVVEAHDVAPFHLITPCPKDCSAHGHCYFSRGGQPACACLPGWTGDTCALRDVSHGGHQRRPGCSVEALAVNRSVAEGAAFAQPCSSNGVCVDGRCLCDDGWGGIDCAERLCLGSCSGRGLCVEGTCQCDAEWEGADCGLPAPLCPHNCSTHGRCDGARRRCLCDEGWGGADCSEDWTRGCPGITPCSGRGACYRGRCACEQGYAGEACQLMACPNGCSKHGTCTHGSCACDQGWEGEDCSLPSCDGCVHGVCRGRSCECEGGWSGLQCEQRMCDPRCAEPRGRCVDGTCACASGWSGTHCTIALCRHDCSAHGRCVGGQCACDEGWTGDDCSVAMCEVRPLASTPLRIALDVWMSPCAPAANYEAEIESLSSADALNVPRAWRMHAGTLRVLSRLRGT